MTRPHSGLSLCAPTRCHVPPVACVGGTVADCFKRQAGEVKIPQMGEAIEVLPVEPKRGTRDWVLAQPVIDRDGTLVPVCHRIPEGASLLAGEDDGFCRVLWPDGRRCRATRIRGMLLCSGHAGGGDPEAGVIAARAKRTLIKERRTLLGIGPNRVGNPRAHARMRALERAEEIARALVDGPLDDRDLGSMERQRAVVTVLDATFPLQSTTVEIELPADGEAVSAMGWEAMQALAGRLLEPVPDLYQVEETA